MQAFVIERRINSLSSESFSAMYDARYYARQTVLVGYSNDMEDLLLRKEPTMNEVGKNSSCQTMNVGYGDEMESRTSRNGPPTD